MKHHALFWLRINFSTGVGSRRPSLDKSSERILQGTTRWGRWISNSGKTCRRVHETQPVWRAPKSIATCDIWGRGWRKPRSNQRWHTKWHEGKADLWAWRYCYRRQRYSRAGYWTSLDTALLRKRQRLYPTSVHRTRGCEDKEAPSTCGLLSTAEPSFQIPLWHQLRRQTQASRWGMGMLWANRKDWTLPTRKHPIPQRRIVGWEKTRKWWSSALPVESWRDSRKTSPRWWRSREKLCRIRQKETIRQTIRWVRVTLMELIQLV